MKVGIKRPSPAMVIAMVALIVTLTGTAYAALKPHSVGSRQLKPRAVKKAKIANGAVKGKQVAKKTLGGRNINLNELGTVPDATSAQSAGNAVQVNGHSASCDGGTILVRGTCYDSSPQGPILGVKAAADACASRGGFLPGTTEALAIRGAVSLGDGNGSNSVFTDSIAANTLGVAYGTTVVNNGGAVFVQLENEKKEEIAVYHYVCAFELIR